MNLVHVQQRKPEVSRQNNPSPLRSLHRAADTAVRLNDHCHRWVKIIGSWWCHLTKVVVQTTRTSEQHKAVHSIALNLHVSGLDEKLSPGARLQANFQMKEYLSTKWSTRNETKLRWEKVQTKNHFEEEKRKQLFYKTQNPSKEETLSKRYKVATKLHWQTRQKYKCRFTWQSKGSAGSPATKWHRTKGDVDYLL